MDWIDADYSKIFMSQEAQSAFYRLTIRPRLDGTAMLVLYHLCWRHNTKTDTAWPSLNGMSSDLDLPRRTLVYALGRLESTGLINRSKGRGRGHKTQYRLPFLGAHRAKPGNEPFKWRNKGCYPPHLLDKEKVPSSVRKGAVERSKKVLPTAPEKKKTIINGPSSKKDGDENRGNRVTNVKTAAEIFEEVLKTNQSGKRHGAHK